VFVEGVGFAPKAKLFVVGFVVPPKPPKGVEEDEEKGKLPVLPVVGLEGVDNVESVGLAPKTKVPCEGVV